MHQYTSTCTACHWHALQPEISACVYYCLHSLLSIVCIELHSAPLPGNKSDHSFVVFELNVICSRDLDLEETSVLYHNQSLASLTPQESQELNRESRIPRPQRPQKCSRKPNKNHIQFVIETDKGRCINLSINPPRI